MDRRVTIAFGAAFAAYAAASLLWSTDPLWGGAWIAALAAGWPLAFVRPRPLWLAFVVFIIASLIVSWASADLIPWGPFGNPNYFGCAIALALAGALAYNLAPWFTIPFLFAGLFYCQSRGALIGAAFAAFLWTWRRVSPFSAIAIAIVAFAAVHELGLGRGDAFAQRLGIWHDVSEHLSIFGVGAGSFYDAYWAFPIHTNATLVHATHAYNDFLELIFLFGIGTIPLWFFLAGTLPASTSEARLVFWTFCVLGLSFFPLFIFPLNTLLAATLARALMENRYGSLETRRAALSESPRYRMGV